MTDFCFLYQVTMAVLPSSCLDISTLCAGCETKMPRETGKECGACHLYWCANCILVTSPFTTGTDFHIIRHKPAAPWVRTQNLPARFQFCPHSEDLEALSDTPHEDSDDPKDDRFAEARKLLVSLREFLREWEEKMRVPRSLPADE